MTAHTRGLLLLRGLDLEVEQESDRFLLQALEHCGEHVEALALVLDERIALRHGAQADALLEVVHLVEVLAPLAVEDRQQHATLEFAHRILAGDGLEFGLATCVGGAGVLEKDLEQTVAVEVLVLGDERLVVDTHRVEGLERRPQLLEIPVLDVALGSRTVDVGGDHVGEHVLHLTLEVLAAQDPAALLVDDGALLVHHLVVLEDVLADLEVLLLDLRLRALDGLGDHLRLDRHVVGQVQPRHDRLERRTVEAAHQLVAEREVEPRLARVALTTGTTTELVVDTTRLVPFGAEHVQATGGPHLLGIGLRLGLDPLEDLVPGRLVLLRRVDRVEAALTQLDVGEDVGVAAEHDVGTATGHVRRDRHRAGPAGLRDDLRFLLVELRVEHAVRNTALGELPGQVFRSLDARRTDEDRLALLVTLDDVVDDGRELRFLGLVDQVALVDAHHRAVGRDRDDTQAVDLVELGGLGLGRTGHARQLVVQAEVVLQRDRGERLVLGLDLDAFLGLDRLVHALVVAAARQDAAGELVDDDDLAVADDVVLVLGVEFLGLMALLR